VCCALHNFLEERAVGLEDEEDSALEHAMQLPVVEGEQFKKAAKNEAIAPHEEWGEEVTE
jgi:hypothetical protein